MSISSNSIEDLNKNIEILSLRLEQANSLPRKILLGLVSGLPTVIGATIVATVVIAILSRSIKTLSDIPIVGPLIENTQMEQYINR